MLVLVSSDVLLVLSPAVSLLDCVLSLVLVELVSVLVVVWAELVSVLCLLVDVSEVVACSFCAVGTRVRRVPMP